MPTFTGVDGASLHYEVVGVGAPVVVLHGGAGLDPVYLGDLAGLSAGYQLIVVQLRGVGRSPLPADPLDGSYWRQARDLELLREHLGLELLTIVAHSAGTRLALAYAAQYPVGPMVLITPPSAYVVDVPSDVDILLDKRKDEPGFAAALKTKAQGPDVNAGDDAFNEWHRAGAMVGYAAWTEVEQEHSRIGKFSLQAALNYFSVDPPEDFPDRLRKVQSPVLVIAGADDCTTGVSQVVALSMLFPRGGIALIDRCGHFPWVERPKEFREAVDAFLGAGFPPEVADRDRPEHH
ncbi:alpha/beta hydrolase [Actinocrispum sp. NPDC049592]|uniref:alpha/beta fold hydrolase n=1 Tax=Actinocrispum sp. NPDC049592 TaxID=3154835 RepID=UPI003420B334